jgi:hypothetical protein
LVERRADLFGKAAADAGVVGDVFGVDPAGEEPGKADDKHEQRDEEQEQAERERAADDGAGDLAVPPVGPQGDVDQRPVLVLVQQGGQAGLLRLRSLPGRGHQRVEPTLVSRISGLRL